MSLQLSIYRRLPRIAPSPSSPSFPFSTSTLSSQISWEDSPDFRSSSSSPSRPSWSAPKHNDLPNNKRRTRMPRVVENQPPTREELERRKQRRIERAERLERKDLTAQLTQVKTYMGGFTQPKHLHFLNTLDPTRKEKDSYDLRVGPNRIKPSAEAYEPHSVYLAVSRYPIRWGHGRSTRRECLSGFCKTSQLEQRFKELNYGVWKEEETRMVKLGHGKPKEPRTTPAHWSCSTDTKEYIDQAILPGSPEERSMLNKPISNRIRAFVKEIERERKRLQEDHPLAEDQDKSVLKELEKQHEQVRKELLPPVSKDWTRPSPPFLDHRLIVPLLVVTLPTRPLASTLARLCNGHPRGLPFIASVPNEDRKDGPSLFRRLLRMRSNRILELTKELVYKLQGNAGGLMSLRMNPDDRGRGIEGEGLGKEIREPENGWAEISWLEEESEIWNGIEKETYIDSWSDLEGVRRGKNFNVEGIKLDQTGTTTTEDNVHEEEVTSKEEVKPVEEETLKVTV
ncbi:hypothetical protein JCM5350_002099 [Sporobolomyces pararoseus]